MVKLTYCLRRRDDMTWDGFSQYWRDVHAPLVAARAGVLGIRRYVQLRSAATEAPELHGALQQRNEGSPAPYDGVAELWFDDDQLEARQSDEAAFAARELLDDEWEVVG